MKFLLYSLGSDAPPAPPSPEAMAEIGKLIEDATKAGILVVTGGLAPTAQGAKLQLSSGKMTVTDGPFAETKEIVGGFAIIDVPSMEEALEWAKRFRLIDGDGESRVRPIYA
ncbi:MAG TPA: YciI family protein [Limnochordia bacterium]|nr:YciI family protein [Limnochordia bacterium]